MINGRICAIWICRMNFFISFIVRSIRFFLISTFVRSVIAPLLFLSFDQSFDIVTKRIGYGLPVFQFLRGIVINLNIKLVSNEKMRLNVKIAWIKNILKKLRKILWVRKMFLKTKVLSKFLHFYKKILLITNNNKRNK